MKRAIILVAMLALAARPAGAARGAKLKTFAYGVELHWYLANLQQASVEQGLGKPDQISYEWCNSPTGCVDRKDELRSTAMYASWSDHASKTFVWIKLCRHPIPGELWQVVAVVHAKMGKTDAWGTRTAPETLYESRDTENSSACYSGR